jgi:hypothetical protein
MENSEPEDGQRKKVATLRKDDRVHMYGTVVTVTGTPYPEGGPGWMRVPMIWDGVRCAPPELAGTEVVLAAPQDGPGSE